MVQKTFFLDWSRPVEKKKKIVALFDCCRPCLYGVLAKAYF